MTTKINLKKIPRSTLEKIDKLLEEDIASGRLLNSDEKDLWAIRIKIMKIYHDRVQTGVWS